MGERILIFGAGALAKCAADAILLAVSQQSLAFVDRAPTFNSSIIGIPVIAEDEILSSGSDGIKGIVVAVGDNWQRDRLAEQIAARLGKVSFSKVVHPCAHISPFAHVAEGAIILAGSVVNPNASIGRCSVLWSNSVVEHDCRLADFTTLSPGAALGGRVSIGSRSFLGIGACVRHNTSIGQDVVIAAGATVISNVQDEAVYAGTPARLLRRRLPGEAYL